MDSHVTYGAANVNKLTDKMPEYVICRYCKEKVSKRHLQRHIIGKFSYKKSKITIFGQKHFKQNFITKFDIFHEKISITFHFGLYLD